MKTKVGEHSGCCLWLGFDQAGTEEAAQLPAACGRLPSELLEMHLGLGREEKSKLPQSCRHKSNKRNGGRAVSEVWLAPPLGGCVLKTALCRLVLCQELPLWTSRLPSGPSEGWGCCGCCGDGCGRKVETDQFPVSAGLWWFKWAPLHMCLDQPDRRGPWAMGRSNHDS